MKDKKLSLFNIQWKVEKFKLLEGRRPKPLPIKGAVFKPIADKEGNFKDLLLRPADEKEFIKLPTLLNIPPTIFVQDGVIYVVVIIGSDPCEFHRLIMRFGGFEDGKPWFKFEVIPIYDDCICKPHGQTILFSGHGIGGGGWFED